MQINNSLQETLYGSGKSVFFICGIIAAILLWVIEPFVNSFLFSSITVYDAMFSTDSHEIYLRSFVSVNIIIASFIYSVFLFRARQIEESISESDIKYHGLLNTAPDGIVTIDTEGCIEIVNKQLESLTGYKAGELIGKRIEILIPERFIDHEHQRKSYLSNPHPRKMGESGIDLYVRRKDGSEFPADISLSPLKLEKGTIVSATIRNISEQKQANELLIYQANHDDLTGLVNRREFENRAERLLSKAKKTKSEHALCFMDLDQFKVINDTCGHTAGDEMLRQLSLILLNTIRHRDTLGRLGGDEFGVLIEHCSMDDAYRVATSLQDAIQDFQFSWEGQSFRVGVSMGLVPITNSTTNLSETLSKADMSCYIAKEKGRNLIQVYQSEDNYTVQRYGEMLWVSRINDALDNDSFSIYAQEIEALDKDSGCHYEFLIRMNEENGDTIPPGAFLPSAERYNLITKIDRWMIRNVFHLLSLNSNFHDKMDFCSINLSGRSLAEAGFLDFIKLQFNKTGINPEKICFEITETAAITNLNLATKFISQLNSLGCKFALDDFGSGLSSFGYLKHLHVDYLKIDGMFIKDIVDNPIDHAMVKSINEIGQVMGMKTTAEYVENKAIKDSLKELGVNYAQGYGISVPQPINNILNQYSNIINFSSIKSA
jgi:diguanylate cyclase (GGDEF)-like protein/PAS domain S-box-containing protein